MMGTQLLHESYVAGVSKFVGVGTICAYPNPSLRQSSVQATRFRPSKDAPFACRTGCVIDCCNDTDPNTILKTHKLKGNWDGLWTSWVEYDCRIVFLFDITDG